MAIDQENVSKILSVLSHPLRREILIILNEKTECSFTDLVNALNVGTAKLSFHIRSLSGLLDQTFDGKYRITKMGENAIRIIKDVETWAVEADLAAGASTSIPLASLKKRAFAFFVDFAVILSVFAIAAVVTGLFSSIAASNTFRLDINIILFFIVFWVYSTLLEGFAGQSLGKRIIGLAVIRIDGKKLFYDNAAVRNFGKIIPILPFDLLIGARLDDKRFLRYFDKFAGTTVVDLRP